MDEGQVVAGHYRVLERVGSGGMGVVWRASDERLQRVVAVKQLLLQPGLSAAETESARQRTLREARIAARLQHPNAIVVFDVAEHNGEPCLVLEYMASRSLAAVLDDRGSLPASEVAGIGRQIASGLAAAHAAGIVHRDVKPGNVLIDDAGIAKITDFGVSRAAGDVTVTQTGIMAGTPAYLAPEVARGQEPTPASDVFSLGATLYAAVEGRVPFGETDNQLAMLHAAAAGRVEPPQRAGPLTGMLMNLLQADPAKRPEMAQAATGLAAAARDTGMAARRPQSPAGAAQPPSAGAQPSGSPARGARTQPGLRPLPETAQRLASSAGAGSERTGLDRGGRRALLLVGIVVLVLALGGLGFALIPDRPPGPDPAQAAGPPSATEPPVTSRPSSTPRQSPPPPPPAQVEPVAPDTSGGPIEFSAAGQLVIDYYNGLDDPDSAWQLLSPSAQQSFGSQAAFGDYWAQYEQVSARNAQGVTRNDDGSVDVPVDVSYGDSRQEKRVLRITSQDGLLLIDSEAR
ncbi:MAG: protein kinase [Pseudonocardiaceae bacterium]|nr:protein kinase [Pseudonocardiaceae bacterium]